jgi:hypothetical protein
VIAFAPIAGLPPEYLLLEPSAGRVRQRQAVRQAAEFHDAAAQLTPERLAEVYAAERAAAPSVHGAGRTYFVDRSGKPRASGARTATRSTSAPRSCATRVIRASNFPTRRAAPPARLPGAREDRAGRRAETKGIARFDLLGIGPGDRLAVIQMRYLEPAATRCHIGDTPLRVLLEGLTYSAIADANRAALAQEILERFGPDRRERAAAAVRGREHALLGAVPQALDAEGRGVDPRARADLRRGARAIGVPVQYLALRLEGSPGWGYGEQGPGAVGSRAPVAGLGALRRPREAQAEAAAAHAHRAGAAGRRGRSVAARARLQRERQLPRGRSHRASEARTGVVQGSAGAGKIRVRFDERLSVLVHERSA